MTENRVNLFIYGSLRDRRIFKSVSGYSFSRKASKIDAQTLFAEPAILPGYRRLSPDNVYYYAVEAPASRIDGIVIHDVPASAIAEIDRYEGKRYERETVTVNAAAGSVETQAYLVSHESMEEHFGDRFHVNLIHELWLRKRIEKFIKRHIRPGERTLDAELERRANRELIATTERDLVMSHYHADAVSDYYLEHELDRPLPSIKHLIKDRQAEPFIRKYIALLVRQVLLSQLDERIQERYRFEIEHMRTSERYFKRTPSIIAALRIINANKGGVDRIVQQCIETMPIEKYDLIDYVKYAVKAAKSMFHARIAHPELLRISNNIQGGLVPLGLEVELSNIGPAAVEPQRSIQKKSDPVYDGFMYFYDFQMHVLSWKLGGYIDDHSGAADNSRRRGFLELAPGRLNIAGELSRPATADPWMLNQLIHEISDFYDVAPHSLHLSLQIRRRQIGKQKILPLGFVKCLLLLGGGLEKNTLGKSYVSRMMHDEITQSGRDEELVFARTSKRNWYLGGDEIAAAAPAQATTYVQQFKFIRLRRNENYEPLIICLKGLQLAYNPADYLTAEQLAGSEKLRKDYHRLKAWSMQPTGIPRETINAFLSTIQYGLMNEAHRAPFHKLHYIEWAMNTIEAKLASINATLKPLRDS
ncbi:MAG: gamma-glutamylcyclotransferase [Sedimentisphaerales bacterium]|nr:gamma-glutamylcyclotransferase [Sedimentisphaerales bacterium]